FAYWNDGGSWSISAEAFFYLLFPFILARLAGRSARQLAGVAVAAYFLAVLPGLSLVLFQPDPSNGIYYSMPIYRLPAFVVGVCACLLARHAARGARADALCVLAVLGLVAYLGSVGMALPLYVSHDWLVVPVVALVLATLAASRGLLARALSA